MKLYPETHFSVAPPQSFLRNSTEILAAHSKPGCTRGTKLL